MPIRERKIQRGEWLVQRDLDELGRDLRIARFNAGLTLREVAEQLGVAQSTVLGNERARYGSPPHLLGRHAAAVGLRVRIKAYPDGDALRDAASVRLIAAFRARLPANHRFRPEVPVSDTPGDLRAWDGVLFMASWTCALEFVTRFHDCQRQLRGFELKLRDGSVDRLVVVVNATHTNRRALATARDVVAASFPLHTRRVLSSLSAGRDPGANGLVLMSRKPRDTQADTAKP
jgi:transcriptional regulator with XRE-family HTH domain